MSRKLICDGCGEGVPETEEEKRRWALLKTSKLDNPSSVLKTWELCPACTTEVGGFITRLFPPPGGGSKPAA